jgi:ATP-dependent RNA helicase RhlE
MHRVPQAHKRDLLAHLIKHHDWQQVLVFTRTKHGANKLAEKLIKDGITAAAIHGNKSQSARTKALASFKDGSVRVLVATDIAARGIDIDQLPQVVNFELPNVAEDYVHRIGRTGRAGTTGSALSLVDDEEMSYLRDIEKLIKRSIVRVEIEPGFVPPAKADLMSDERPPRPPQGRGGQRQGAGQRQGQNTRQGQPGGRNASGRAPQGKPADGSAKPAANRAAPKPSGTNPSNQPRKPRPQAALFSSKPGTRGH